MSDHRTLKAWQLANRLASACRLAARRLPGDERHALADQLRRAGYSVSLNIVEGTARRTVADRLQYLYLARTSLAEISAILVQVWSARYLSRDQLRGIRSVRDECDRTLNGYIRMLEDRRGGKG